MIVKLKASGSPKSGGGVSAALAAPEQRLLKALRNQAVKSIEPVFRQKQALRPGERIQRPDGLEVERPDLSQWYRVSLRDDKADLFAIVEELQKSEDVEWAEPDYLRRLAGDPQPRAAKTSRNRAAAQSAKRTAPSSQLALVPGPSSDPLFSQQWHLSAARLTDAWAYLDSQGLPAGGSRDVIVAVIDSGIDLDHQDLAANLWTNAGEVPGDGVDNDSNGFVDDVHGANTVSNLRTGNPEDDHGHGTHVAGIIAAQAGNHQGGVGVAYNVQIMAIKAAQYSGVLSSSDIAEAINYAVAQGADVINMSFGGYSRSTVEEDALAVAFGQSVLVAAAGNDGKVNLPCPLGRDMYPAAYNWVLGIMGQAASPDSDGSYLAPFSNTDCTPRDTHEYELMAPAVDIWSTLPGDAYGAWDGTSMAAPIVAGIAALVRTRFWDRDLYSSRFIMGQIAATGDFGGGFFRANALASLTTVPEPSLSYLQHWLFDDPTISPVNDSDGIADAGETIHLAVMIRNHWGAADDVSVTLEPVASGAVAPDPYVTMLVDTVEYGALGSFNSDDNGLLYDGHGAVIGVQAPFRVALSTETPNDHLVPFKITVHGRNRLQPSDPPRSFESFFWLKVQRGSVLPSVIDHDMTLTPDRLWLVAGSTLVTSGATVTILPGTQVQYYSATPAGPYQLEYLASIGVQGVLTAAGSLQDPIELFLDDPHNAWVVRLHKLSGGTVNLSFVKGQNPGIIATNVDRCDFVGTGDYVLQQPINSVLYYFGREHFLEAATVTRTRFRHLSLDLIDEPPNPGSAQLFHFNSASWAEVVPSIQTSLFQQCYMHLYWRNQCAPLFSNNTLLNNSHASSGSATRWCRSVLMFGNDGGCVDRRPVINNAFLERYINLQPARWTNFRYVGSGSPVDLSGNYWGTTSDQIIGASVFDRLDDYSLGEIRYQPVLTGPSATTYPFVVNVSLAAGTQSNLIRVGAELVTFTVSFNRDMDTTVQPQVSFGPDVPMTDYTIHPINGGWTDPQTWVGSFNITPLTGDGYQLIRVAGARAADDHWLETGDDAGRFRFEIITSGTEAMNLQATGGEGFVDLSWTQDDFDLLAGYNLYRSTSAAGPFERINPSVIPSGIHSFRDTNVSPGAPYFYKFTVVKTDMSESAFSNLATATPIDTVPPVISHSPLTQAPPGLGLTLQADVTDNVSVKSVTLYFRSTGTTDYQARSMTTTGGNRYTATIEGSRMVSPGVDYYMEATDGVSTVRSGRPEYPYQIVVVDRPVIATISPNRGPASGGTAVTISGSNFKSPATVTFGGAAAGSIVVVSSSQITCTTPQHFPSAVDVSVTCSNQTGTLLNAFTYESTTASLSLPEAGGGQHALVQIPVNAASVSGLAAASFTVTFDQSVLTARGAVAGSLTPGWGLAVNRTTPGQVRVSMASPGGTVTGSGTLAIIEFEVVGAPASTSALALSEVLLNDGAIPFTTGPGSFRVDQVYQVSGTIRFWNGSLPIPAVSVGLSGDRLYSALTGIDGAYTVGGAASDDYTLRPERSDGASGITAYDASLVLQHDAHLATLTGSAAVAADVNKSGSITAMDAFYILQKAVGLISLPFPGAGEVWSFSPATRTFTNLSANQTGQDFTGILLGDVSGNWGGSGQSTSGQGIGGVKAATSPSALDLFIGNREFGSDGQAIVPVSIDGNGAVARSLEFSLAYSPDQLEIVGIEKGPCAGDWLISSNATEPGVLQVALAGTLGLISTGEVVRIKVKEAGLRGNTGLVWKHAQVNEGGVKTVLRTSTAHRRR